MILETFIQAEELAHLIKAQQQVLGNNAVVNSTSQFDLQKLRLALTDLQNFRLTLQDNTAALASQML
jgi:hypothetical protein